MRILILAVVLFAGPVCADAARPDPPSARSIRAALAALEDSAFEAREQACEDLKDWCGRFPEEILAALPEVHDDPDVSFRLEEIRRRARFFQEWKEPLAAVADASRVREALDALAAGPSPGRIGELARSAGPRARLFWRAFTAHLEHPDPKVRRAAIRELVEAGAVEASPSLAQVLSDDKDYGVRLDAAEAAGRLRCREAIPHLVACMKMDRRTRLVARQAITRIGDPSAVPPLVGLLYEVSDDDVRKEVLCLLDILSASDPSIAPAAAARLDDPDERMRARAVSILSRIAGADWTKKHPPERRIELAREWWERQEAAR